MHDGTVAQRLSDSSKSDTESENQGKPDAFIRRLTGIYQRLLVLLVALLPLMMISYLELFQDPKLLFEAYGLHEVASLLAIALGAFVTYVTWRCYLASGEIFLRWLALAFLGFTLVYLPHGLFTRFSDDMMALFLAYGPASRLAMAICLLVALKRFGKPVRPSESRRRPTTWGMAVGIFLAIDLGLAAFFLIPMVSAKSVIPVMEALALALFLAGIIVTALRRIRLPLMIIYLLSLAAFAQASIAFLISDPWSHLWWLAHVIFTTGFLLLSYGVVHAFHTTGSFSTVYSQAEVMKQVRQEQAHTQEALAKLKTANTRLAQQAATDWLTGAANRRQLTRQARRELARAQRNGTPLSLLCLDIDHFKTVNDVHGHQAGDQVLKQVALTMQQNLRPTDLLARVGGEEFQVLLPDANSQQAGEIAERIRSSLHDLEIRLHGKVLKVTVSVGSAQMVQDGKDLDSIMRAGDERLYEAKALGRNRVVTG
ncbi:GGDEF domain-containing protein [Halomonas daqiaonensis]|nr:GGDEF domain-containing protein [Halomonas daqiaonensis]